MKKFKDILKPLSLASAFALLIGVLYYSGCFEYLKWSVWKEIHLDIKEFTSHNMLLAVGLAIGCYMLAIMTFLPGLLLFDLLVGYMFPQPIAIGIILTSVVLGAVMIVSGCRFGFKKFLTREDNKLLGRIQKGFAENETMYLLFLRVMPFFPFAFVSAALASLPVSYKKVAWTTLLGMAPIAIVLTGVGHSLGELMQLDKQPAFSEVVSPSMMAGIALLTLASVFPILWKKFAKSKAR